MSSEIKKTVTLQRDSKNFNEQKRFCTIFWFVHIFHSAQIHVNKNIKWVPTSCFESHSMWKHFLTMLPKKSLIWWGFSKDINWKKFANWNSKQLRTMIHSGSKNKNKSFFIQCDVDESVWTQKHWKKLIKMHTLRKAICSGNPNETKTIIETLIFSDHFHMTLVMWWPWFSVWIWCDTSKKQMQSSFQQVNSKQFLWFNEIHIVCVKSLPLKTNLIIVCKHTVIMKIEVSFFKKEMIFNGCFPNDSFSTFCQRSWMNALWSCLLFAQSKKCLKKVSVCWVFSLFMKSDLTQE